MPPPPSLSAAHAAFHLESSSCVCIQRVFRGWRVRLHLAEFHAYAAEIQRVYRGHLGRKRVRRALDAREASANAAQRHFAAALIQSCFKGCYSRKYIHDFHERKRYVAGVVARGEVLRGELEAAFARKLRAELEARDAKARADFRAATAGLHHLVSTSAVPGVYNPPWATTRAEVPSAFGVELEVHLRAEVLRTLRTRGLRGGAGEAARAATAVATGGSALDASVTLLGHTAVAAVPAYASAGSRASVQAAAPYDAPVDAARAEARASKLRQLGDRPLLAGTRGRVFEAPKPLGVHAAVPFVEPWLAARSDRETEHQRKGTWVTGGVPFVPMSSTASRLFEDSERRAAVRAAAVLGSKGATPAAAGAAVESLRVGETLLRGARAGAAATARAARGSALADAAALEAAGAYAAVGSAVAAARARAREGQHAAPPPAAPQLPPPPVLQPPPPRKRPLMRPIPAVQQKPLPEGLKGQVTALTRTFLSQPSLPSSPTAR